MGFVSTEKLRNYLKCILQSINICSSPTLERERERTEEVFSMSINEET
jgi:hypothetical protein